MATKRAAPSVHPSRQSQVPQEPSRKKRKVNPTPHSQPKAHPINSIKYRIRSLQRLLGHNDHLPADIKIGHERELQSLQWDLEQAKRAERRKEMIGRWHKVRFFDRQKAMKRLKKARKAIEACGEEDRAGLELKAHEEEVNVDYAIYYPLDVAYVPLFPTRKKRGSGQDDEERESEEPANGAEVAAQGNRKMWELVEHCMGDGRLDALRNGKIALEQVDGSGPVTSALPSVKNTKSTPSGENAKRKKAATEQVVHGTRKERRAAKAAAAKEDEEDSEGGFFE